MKTQINNSHNSHDPPVTVSVFRQVKPVSVRAFEEFLSGIIDASMTFEGHLGTNVFRNSDPNNPEYMIVFKFDRRSNLRRWEESQCRRQWLIRIESLTIGSPAIEVLTGLETWFTISPLDILLSPLGMRILGYWRRQQTFVCLTSTLLLENALTS